VAEGAKTMSIQKINALNMIPFIDIMLVLLVIVLMTSSFIASGRIPVNLPTAKNDSAVERDEPVQISITAEGQIFLETEAVALDALAGRVSGKSRETAFLLRADQQTRVQAFISVVDTLKRLGFTKVAVETRAAN
jgi:biopolymer transport protein ExbD